ncbi:MAG TPA: TRAM domain-containing protein, partial [Ilumatobacteraceae bacterium]
MRPVDPATFELVVGSMVVGGACIARDAQGRVVFVSGAMPGERVVVAVRQAKKDFATADVVAVVEASRDRVEPPCEAWHRGCGGCDWQHIRAEAQLPLKVEMVREALTRTGRIAQANVIGGGSVPAWGYRTTVRVAAAPDRRPGFRARRSHAVVGITSCPVADDAINALLPRVRITSGEERTVRVGLSSQMTSLDPDGHVVERVCGRDLRVSTGSFFQSSPAAATLLVEAVQRALDGADLAGATVLDAYGGVGLFAATVGRGAARVIVVESSASACADARVNLATQPASVVQMAMEEWPPEHCDIVVADPARAGLGRSGTAVVAATEAERIILISCDAGSLGR